MNDIGVSCKKQSYKRGAGTIPDCEPELEKNQGVCYNPCPAGSNGVGPACYSQCPASYSSQCGAGCTTNRSECAAAATKMTTAPIGLGLTIAEAVVTYGANAADFPGQVQENIDAFNFPLVLLQIQGRVQRPPIEVHQAKVQLLPT